MALRISLNKATTYFLRDLRVLNKSNLSYVTTSVKSNLLRTLYTAVDDDKLPLRSASNAYRKDKRENEDALYVPLNDPDVFGQSIAPKNDTEVDAGDIEEENYIQNPPRKSQKLDTKEYAKLIKDYLNENKIKEAIDILEVRMKEDRVKPGKYIFNILISGCARAGFSKKAFQLYNKMKQRAIPVTGGTYTSLFNACANDQWSKDGLERITRLREIMLEKGHIPNVKNYNVMIKAYGRCGDVKTAFQLVDEMLEKKLQITTETFNFLLQACASDEEHGFRHALLTWHKLLSRNVTPDIYSFNLILRCTRDCSIGDIETMKETITQILGSEHNLVDTPSQFIQPPLMDCQNIQNHSQISDNNEESTRKEDKFTDICGEKDLSKIEDKSNDIQKTNADIIQNSMATSSQTMSAVEEFQTPVIVDAAPNLLCKTPHLGSLVSIAEVTGCTDRFLLLGGISGFLAEMKKVGITPGIDTFTAMLEVIPPTKSAEKQLIGMIRKIGIKTDIDFFNILIKKRSMRFDYEGAKEVLSMIKTAKLNPDIVTYGVLALGCKTQEDARELLHEMRSKNIRMNIHILGAMLRQGCCHNDFSYVHEIMQIALEERIKPNADFLKHLDNFYKYNKKLVTNNHPSTRSKTFKHNFKNFVNKLNIWQTELGIENLTLDDAIKKISENPYRRLKEENKQGFEEIKNEKLARKQKRKQYIKRIKLKNLKDDDNVESTIL